MMMNRGLKKELAVLSAVGALLLWKRNRGLSLMLGASSAGLLLSTRTEDSFMGHSVVITGGSRGLGLAMAQEFLRQGARVSLLARDLPELERAKKYLLEEFPHGKILIRSCDVTQQDQVISAFHHVEVEMGGIDALVNNAGAITVGPYLDMTEEDFEAQMELHFYAIMGAVNLALPYLRQGVGRRIVNICSMGGRLAVPHMLPYDVSKFALAGYSQGITAELSEEGISVTTVFPALMRTGSPIQAVFKGDHEKEFAWFQAADVMPLLSADPAAVAKKIVKSSLHRETELIPSLPGKVRMLAGALFPELVSSVLKVLASVMPKGSSLQHKTGAQSRALYDENPVLSLLHPSSDRAELVYNQTPKTDAKFNMGMPH